MKLLKPWLLLVFVFFVGVLFGVAGTRLVLRHIMREVMLHPARIQVAIERHLTRKLSLDATQQAKLAVILSEAHQHVEIIRHEFRPAMVTVFSNANQEISVMLTPEQLARYQQIKKDNAVFLQGVPSDP